MANITYRQATMADADAIWQIISDAKAVMSIDHNPQWDNGYPSPEIIKADIAKGYAYILQLDDEIVATATLWQEKDVNYQRLQGGRWLYPTISPMRLSIAWRCHSNTRATTCRQRCLRIYLRPPRQMVLTIFALIRMIKIKKCKPLSPDVVSHTGEN